MNYKRRQPRSIMIIIMFTNDVCHIKWDCLL